jgi:hypothetical protein
VPGRFLSSLIYQRLRALHAGQRIAVDNSERLDAKHGGG